MPVNFNDFMRRMGCKNQTELAEKLGMSQSALSAWGSGFRSPRYEDCKRLLSMGMKVGELFGEELEVDVNTSKANGEKFDMFLDGLNELLERISKSKPV